MPYALLAIGSNDFKRMVKYVVGNKFRPFSPRRIFVIVQIAVVAVQVTPACNLKNDLVNHIHAGRATWGRNGRQTHSPASVRDWVVSNALSNSLRSGRSSCSLRLQ